ncbi:MAG: hypothetical protein Q4F00_12455 [bacterium]|nr:hypothetical protein [bacterium]
MLSEEPKRPEIEKIVQCCLSDNFFDDPRTADGVTSCPSASSF